MDVCYGYLAYFGDFLPTLKQKKNICICIYVYIPTPWIYIMDILCIIDILLWWTLYYHLRVFWVFNIIHDATSWLQHTATHCNTLQHTTTHCNTHNPWCNIMDVSSMCICVYRCLICVYLIFPTTSYMSCLCASVSHHLCVHLSHQMHRDKSMKTCSSVKTCSSDMFICSRHVHLYHIILSFTIYVIHITSWISRVLSCRSLSAKEPPIIGLFCKRVTSGYLVCLHLCL